jgi:hypothetical protein
LTRKDLLAVLLWFMSLEKFHWHQVVDFKFMLFGIKKSIDPLDESQSLARAF